MDVSRWPLDRIMQLPDWCFGRRFPVFLFAYGGIGEDAWDIAELGLPDRCVLWEIVMWPVGVWAATDSFRLALGDQLPTSIAMMSSLDPLLHGMGQQGAEPRTIRSIPYDTMRIRQLKMLIESHGRRPILEISPADETALAMNVALVFSSIPREVEDWLVSAKAINL